MDYFSIFKLQIYINDEKDFYCACGQILIQKRYGDTLYGHNLIEDMSQDEMKKILTNSKSSLQAKKTVLFMWYTFLFSSTKVTDTN